MQFRNVQPTTIVHQMVHVRINYNDSISLVYSVLYLRIGKEKEHAEKKV